VLRLFKYELTGNERAVYEHLTGYGRPKLSSTSEIAKKLKMPDYQVSRLKNAIQKKLKRYLG
jgi:DNA-directed RNA polymerase specialized sigma subunit